MNTRLKIHNSGEVEGAFLKCVLRLFLRLHHRASQVLRREVMITVVADWACAPTDDKLCVDHVRGCVVMTFRSARPRDTKHMHAEKPSRVDAGPTLRHISRTEKTTTRNSV